MANDHKDYSGTPLPEKLGIKDGSRATERSGIVRWFDRMAAALEPAGRLWVAWPKKTSKVATDIDFGFAQGIGLDAGLVDNKSASVTDVFQGLQFVYRVKDRPTT